MLVWLVPVLVDLVRGWPRRLFGYVAADTFYYLVIGRSSVDSGIIGYDGEHWSNGFHPLWQAIVAALYALHLPGTRSHLDLLYVIAISLLMQGFALYLLAKCFVRRDGSLTVLFMGVPVGAYAALVSPVWLTLSRSELRAQNPFEGSEPLYGTWWSYANGMETSLVLLCYAGVFYAYRHLRPRWSPRNALLLGGLLVALSLSRLDHAIFALGVWAACGLDAWFTRQRASLRGFAITTGTFFGAMAVYLAINAAVFGSALPVSGRLKTTMPHLTLDNFRLALESYESLLSGNRMPIYSYWRVLQLLVPGAFALASPLLLVSIRLRNGMLVCRWSTTDARVSEFLAVSAIGVLGLASYNFFFVPAFHQGHWYYPISVVYVSLLVLASTDLRTRGAASNVRFSPALPWMRPGVGVILAALSIAFFARLHRHRDYHARYARFYFDESPRVRAAFAGPEPKLLCFDDGIVAYATSFPAMSATGLALDLEAALASREGRLLEVALARGFNHLTSLVYVDFGMLHRDAPEPDRLQHWKQGTPHFGDLSQTSLRIAYLAQDMNFALIEASR